MDGARHELLAGATLALQQHLHARVDDVAERLEDALHLGRARDDAAEAEALVDDLAEVARLAVLLAIFERVLDGADDAPDALGLRHEEVHAAPLRLELVRLRAVRGHHDDAQVRVRLEERLDEIESVRVGQPQVEQDHAVEAVGDERAALRPVMCGRDVVPLASEVARKQLDPGGFVVDDEDRLVGVQSVTSSDSGWDDPGWRALREAAQGLAMAAGARIWAAEETRGGAWHVARCDVDGLDVPSVVDVPYLVDATIEAKRIIDLSIAAFEACDAPIAGPPHDPSADHAVIRWPLAPRRALVLTSPGGPTPSFSALVGAIARLAPRLAEWSRTELALATLAEGYLLADDTLTVRLATPRAAQLLGASGPDALEGVRLRELDARWPATLPEPGEVVRVHLSGHPVSSLVHTLTTASQKVAADLDAALVVRLRGDAVFNDSRAQQLHLMSALRHDVRSPLTAVRGLVAVLIDEPDIPREERLSLLELLRQESERTVTWVEDYLVMLRLRLDPSAPNATHCDVGPWLAALESYFADHCASRAIALSIVPRPAELVGLTIAAESALLGAFGRNLLGHALRLADEGAHIELGLDPASGHLTLHASGPGLFGRAHEHPFTTLARSTASGKRTPGVGLGLFLVKRIADVYGWPLTLDASPQTGLRVVVRWPIGRL